MNYTIQEVKAAADRVRNYRYDMSKIPLGRQNVQYLQDLAILAFACLDEHPIGEESSKEECEAQLNVPNSCCANENRNMNGGCDNCGAPCL